MSRFRVGLLVVCTACGVFAVAGEALGAGNFDDPGTDVFPMESDLVIDLTAISQGVTTGRFTGNVSMSHGSAVNDCGAPSGPDEVPLTVNSLTQSFGGFTITSISGGGTATSDNCDTDFPASSVITVDYEMTTPYAAPNDVLHGTHTLDATLTGFPPDDIYAGTGPTTIFNSLDNPVGTLSVPAHSKDLGGGSGMPSLGSLPLTLLVVVFASLGVWLARSRMSGPPSAA